MARRKLEIAIWCVLGAIGGWCTAALIYLWAFDQYGPWRYWPWAPPYAALVFVTAVAGLPLAALRAMWQEKASWFRVLVGAGLGVLGGTVCTPLHSSSRMRLLLLWSEDPLFDFWRWITYPVAGETIGALLVVFLLRRRIGSLLSFPRTSSERDELG